MTALPDIAAAAEAGLQDYESSAWLALLAPANTKKAVIDKLYVAMLGATNDPKVRPLRRAGAEPLVLAPQGRKGFMASETSKWATIIRKIGVDPM
jgi:tripartite-type tricarboxylate transporter receptor subunit TctC